MESSNASLTPEQATQLGAGVFIFGFPLVLMEMTRRKMTNVEAPVALTAPANQFAHVTSFPDANFHDVVSPNADTLYSSAFLNLTDEPIVLSVPDTGGRYYLMPTLDGWSNVFASPGSRTTGTGEGAYAYCGPHFDGSLPDGVERIDCPTSMAWIIGRTQTNGQADFEAVHEVQSGFTLTPLSALGTDYTPPPAGIDPDVDMDMGPDAKVLSLTDEEFLSTLGTLMADNPPKAADAPMVNQLAALGVIPGEKFEAAALGDLMDAVSTGIEAVKEKLSESPPQELENGWIVIRDGIGTYGTNYEMRAFVAHIGLGANLPQDAIYPMTLVDADGATLNGSNRYTLHFDAGETPPVHAFWSRTMYDMEQFFVDNPIDRYAIGDRDELQTNDDGSVNLQIQHDEPEAGTSNWLPAPEGDFNVMLRMYWPKDPMLDGSWKLPGVKKTG